MPVRTTFAALALVSGLAAASDHDVILGVLEEVPGVYTGEASSNGVRVVFRRDENGWHSFPSNCQDQQCLRTAGQAYPYEVNWWVAFNGKALGQIKGTTPEGFDFYSHIGLQDLAKGQRIPAVGSPSVQFGGFLEVPVHRPLASISKPYFNDPDGWKPAQLSRSQIQILRHQFRNHFPKLCRRDSQDESKLEPYAFEDRDIRVIRAYASAQSQVIARLGLKDATDCDGTGVGFGIDDPWFVLRSDGSVQYLDSRMWLVDGGDYDGDGRTELIFSIDRYNRGGYELFYDDFRQRAVFQYSYH